jgi:23S rRNA (cytosine1962-C5)-methyltransferase
LRSVDDTRSCSISRRRRIAEALRRRGVQPRLDAFRLVNGAGDGAPGLAVDAFDDVVVVHADSHTVVEEWMPDLREALSSRWPTAYTKVHPRGPHHGAFVAEEPVWGPPRAELEVAERGVRYLVKPAGGLSVGLFLDMREVRQWLRQQVRGKTVLNLFAYTCSFGVSATLGGAARVVNLDVSRPYLEWGKANYVLNDLAVDDRDFVYGDAFDWLSRFARREQRFDLVIVDPPSFSSTPFSVTRDFARLVSASASVVTPGGTLVAATNHAATSDRRFDGWLASGLTSARREGIRTRRWHEPPTDFPVAPGEHAYLKVRAVQLD